MGIDYSGRMVVGEVLEETKIYQKENDVECWYDWHDENGMEMCAPYFDADVEYCTVGFEIDDIPVDDIDEVWLKDIRDKAKKFEELTGTKARLIGTQDIF